MRILVVGAGAVGGYFGGRLAQAGRDVTFLVRAKRAEQLRAGGLRIVSPHGNLTFQPKIATAARIDGPYEVILLGVKSYALSDAMRDFAPAVGADTLIVPVLNGMRHIDLLIDRFGRAVLGGACWVVTDLGADGQVVQMNDIQKLNYGELDGQITARAKLLDETLRGAGFDATLSAGIVSDMWGKWVQLASLGAATCLLRGNVGEIVSVPGGSELVRSIIRECAGIAAACGYPPAESSLEQLDVNLTRAGSPLASSMYRGLHAGAPVEVDAILGDLLEKGKEHEVSTPLVQAAFVALSLYQRRRGK